MRKSVNEVVERERRKKGGREGRKEGREKTKQESVCWRRIVVVVVVRK